MKKIILIFTVSLIGVSLTFIYQVKKFDDKKLHIVFCNVGQGDGILIRTPKGMDIVIDTGPDNSILSCLEKHMPFWDRTIELMLLTHPHADHMRGMIDILQNYKVLSFGTENIKNTTALYNEVYEDLANKKIKVQYIYAGDGFKTADGVSLKVLGPSKEFVSRTPDGIIRESREDGSLTNLLTLGEFNAILTGDAPIEELEEAIGSFPIPTIEVFQIAHHGSMYNSNEDILSKISPQVAIISVGKNTYGHPSKFVLDLLSKLQIKYFRTDQSGDIDISSDGKSFWVN